jgi:hypothetical protein
MPAAATAILLAHLIVLLQTGVTVVLILTTPKTSLLRYLWLLLAAWLSFEFCDLSRSFTTSDVRNFAIGTTGLVVLGQILKVMLLDPLDREDLLKSKSEQLSEGLLSNLWNLSHLVLCPRHINTPWQVKNIPPHPAYYARPGKHNSPGRGSFLRRESFLLAWQLLVLDVTYVLIRQGPAAGQEPTELRYFGVPLSEWAARLSESLFTWFVVMRVLVDTSYRSMAITGVCLGLTTPAQYPPVFGSMWDAYTLRNFWGYVCSFPLLFHPPVFGPFICVI